MGFYFSQILIAATFMPELDCGDVLHVHVSSQSLDVLDTVYHGALSFVTNLPLHIISCRVNAFDCFPSHHADSDTDAFEFTKLF